MPTRRRWDFDSAPMWTGSALVCAVALHVGHLPLWVSAAFVSMVAWRAVLSARGAGLPARGLRLLTLIGIALAVLATFRTFNGLDAGTALLTLMSAMKLLETRTVRDHVVLLMIGYVLVLAAFLYAQQLWLLPLDALVIWLITTALLRATQARDTQTSRESARLAARLLLQAAPLMLLLFLFFPRLPGPLWARPDIGAATSGLGDTMSPGDISELSLSSAVAFRVRFIGDAPPAAQRYWRGPVLHDFDGYTWRRERVFHPSSPPTFSGPGYEYNLMLEPSGRRWVYALDLAESWPRNQLDQTYDAQLLARESIGQPVSYQLRSRTAYRLGETLPLTLQRRDTRFPEGRNPRSIAFAARLRAQIADDDAYVRAVLQMFREQEFYYTLEPPRLDLDSVDDFLFNTRRGFCGHFASSFTTLMRAAGIPARVVTGYQGGELNRFAGYYIVRQSDAHAWSEVWMTGRGWTRVDPTAAVAPERIQGGLSAALGADEPLADRFVRGTRWLAELRFAWDAANTLWRERVVEFNARSQRSLLDRFGFRDADWRILTLLLAGSLIAVMAVLVWQLRRTMNAEPGDPVQRSYERFCRKLERRGILRPAHEGALDFAARLARERPELAALGASVTALYLDLRYGASPKARLAELERTVRQFR
jgi:transglutaminase-like putative cysteine protease